MNGFLITDIFMPIGLLTLFLCLTLLFQYVRGLFNKYKKSKTTKWTLLVFVIAQYLLFISIIFVHTKTPYGLETNHYWNINTGQNPNMCINPTIYYLLTIVFISICITSFRQTFAFFQTNTKRFIGLTVLLSILCYLLFYINSSVFGQYTNDVNDRNLQRLAEYITFGLSTVALLFSITLFRIDRQKILNTIFYTVIPVVVFYFLLFYIQTKFIYISPADREYYYNMIGGYG